MGCCFRRSRSWRETIQRFIHLEHLIHLWVLAAAGVIGFLGNEIAAQVRLRGGRRLLSPALIADGKHARADGYVSLAVVATAIPVATHVLDRMRRMIRLRDGLQGGFGHRRVRWLCALVLVLVAVHCAHDAVHLDEGAALVCVAFAVGGAVVLVVPRRPQLPPTVVAEVLVAVRVVPRSVTASVRGSPAVASPLRL
jgi:hypothetical protein